MMAELSMGGKGITLTILREISSKEFYSLSPYSTKLRVLIKKHLMHHAFIHMLSTPHLSLEL
uniref:Putative ovule protein n=1 Tax=Solanum chacoense TaxID=4108 RepID=A0A0V0IBP4_SOLCH